MQVVVFQYACDCLQSGGSGKIILIPLGILGFRKLTGKIVFPVLLMFLFGKQYLSKKAKSMKGEIEACTPPQTTSIVLVSSVYPAASSGRLFVFQSEVKYFQELGVCLVISFCTCGLRFFLTPVVLLCWGWY